MKNDKQSNTIQISYTIIDGEHEYGDTLTLHNNGSKPEEFVHRVLAEFYACSDEEEHEIVESLTVDGKADIGYRAIKDVNFEEVKPISIIVQGGVIQDISNIPSNVIINVQDYDIENLTEQEIQTETNLDKEGNRCFVSTWGD